MPRNVWNLWDSTSTLYLCLEPMGFLYTYAWNEKITNTEEPIGVIIEALFRFPEVEKLRETVDNDDDDDDENVYPVLFSSDEENDDGESKLRSLMKMGFSKDHMDSGTYANSNVWDSPSSVSVAATSNSDHMDLRQVVCSKGTYIIALCANLAKALGR